ncbi:PA14 domain-containing protein, putative [Babesia ovata]|uniref:PA14 domain-containing protein, putative n=1 Tax=Babesia ovata TaxID=189622 RepID=A0A2H6KH76_9APIC|nr:PA14 domain-containing protein, putative [Babesia ovata]GBE62344.1 PA14 domain-containing protein, putative [Babesia ovata]
MSFPLICYSLANCFAIAILGNVMLIHFVSGGDDTHVRKWVGNNFSSMWDAIADSMAGKHHLYYDIDLYMGERIEVLCPSYDGHKSVLKPLDEGMFYSSDAFQSKLDVTDADGNYHPLSRLKINISDGFHNLSIKKLQDEKWEIMFPKKPTYLTMETLFFDCIATSDSATLHTATLKLNIMPEYYGGKGTQEQINFLTNTFAPDGARGTYFKFPRPGSTCFLTCKAEEKKSTSPKGLFISGTQKSKVQKTHMIDYEEEFYGKKLHDIAFEYCDTFGFMVLVIILQDETQVVGANWLAPQHDTHEVLKTKFNTLESAVLNLYCGNHCNDMYPKNIPQEFIVDVSWTLRVHQFLNNLIVIRRSQKSITVDFSRYNSYRFHEANWYSSTSVVSFAHSVDFTINPVCDFNNPESLDMDGKTCSVHILKGHTIIIRGANINDDDIYMLPAEGDGFFWRKVTKPEMAWNDHTFERVKTESPAAETFDELGPTAGSYGLKFNDVTTTYNPLYYIWSKSTEDDGKNPDKIAMVYYADAAYIVKPDMDLKMDGSQKIDGNSPAGSKMYHVVSRGDKGLHFRCSDFFNSDGGAEYILYPQGKNLIYSNVENRLADPTKIPTAQFQEEYATAGVSMYKAPESTKKYDLEIVFERDKVIFALYKKPLYFICARKDWDKSKHSYVIIGIDPFYQQKRIYGCGTKPEFFLNNEGETNSEQNCEFTIDDNRTVGFFCPMPIPSHFLEGDQKKWAPADGDAIATTNPYKNMIQCYDRTTFFQRLFKWKVDIGLFATPHNVGEVRSLWIFNRGQFIKNGKQAITQVICHCFNAEGRSVASIKVSPEFRKMAT